MLNEGRITKRDHERAQHQPLWHSQRHCTQEGESNRHGRNLLSPHITCLLKVTLHADCVRCKSAILYSCLPLHQDLYIPSDKHVTRNGKWCPLLAELSIFRVRHALFFGCFSLFMSHRAQHQGRWDDKGTAGEGVMVTCTKKEAVKTTAHIRKHSTEEKVV